MAASMIDDFENISLINLHLCRHAFAIDENSTARTRLPSCMRHLSAAEQKLALRFVDELILNITRDQSLMQLFCQWKHMHHPLQPTSHPQCDLR